MPMSKDKEEITIPISEYEMLHNAYEDAQYAEEEKYAQEEEQRKDNAYKVLNKALFELCKTCGETCQLADEITTKNPNLVTDALGDSYETAQYLQEHIEDALYYDPIIGQSLSFSEWMDFFHNNEDMNTVEELLDRCEKLYAEKQALLDKLQNFINEAR